MKVTLAIPNYNGSENIDSIIPRVFEEDFDAVYVLDDCSTDDSLQRLAAYQDRITVVKGDKNVGAGGNRNRIIDHVGDGIIMFLDVDMELKTRDVVPKIKKIFEDDAVALAGGLILNKEGKPMDWNSGPLMDPVKDAKANLIWDLAQRYADNSEVLDHLYELAGEYSASWNVFGREPYAHKTGWAAEGNFCVRAEVFAEVGGYDVAMRYHETHDLNRRIQDTGKTTHFIPEIVAKHLEIDVRGKAREQEMTQAQLYYYQKHWGMSEAVFRRLFDDWNDTSQK